MYVITEYVPTYTHLYTSLGIMMKHKNVKNVSGVHCPFVMQLFERVYSAYIFSINYIPIYWRYVYMSQLKKRFFFIYYITSIILCCGHECTMMWCWQLCRTKCFIYNIKYIMRLLISIICTNTKKNKQIRCAQIFIKNI